MDLYEIMGDELITRENMKEKFEKLFAEYKKYVKTMPKFWVNYVLNNFLARCITAVLPIFVLTYAVFTFSAPHAIAIGIGMILFMVFSHHIYSRFKGKPYGNIISFLILMSLVGAGQIAFFSLYIYKLNPLIKEFIRSHIFIVLGLFAAVFFVILGPDKEKIEDSVCAKMLLKDINHIMEMKDFVETVKQE